MGVSHQIIQLPIELKKIFLSLYSTTMVYGVHCSCPRYNDINWCPCMNFDSMNTWVGFQEPQLPCPGVNQLVLCNAPQMPCFRGACKRKGLREQHFWHWKLCPLSASLSSWTILQGICLPSLQPAHKEFKMITTDKTNEKTIQRHQVCDFLLVQCTMFVRQWLQFIKYKRRIAFVRTRITHPHNMLNEAWGLLPGAHMPAQDNV